MNSRLLATLACCAAALAPIARAADEEAPVTKTSSHMKEVLRERAIEDAKKKPAAPAPIAAKSPTAPATAGAASATGTPAADTGSAATSTPVLTPGAAAAANSAPAAAKDAATKNAQQPATVLPKMEVRKDRITVLDQQIAKQEEDIAREKKNTKTSEVDLALNDSKVAKPLAIFGGESAQFRKRVSSERVELMEAEKDILEAMKTSRTKKEKEDLQKQLDELRAMRRELEKSLRN